MKSQFVVYGSKGHAGVVADLIKMNDGEVNCFFDDFESNLENQGNKTVLAYDSELFKDSAMVIGVGNNVTREEISLKVNHKLATLIHPTASVSSNVDIGEGTVILANSTVQANVRIGKHVIIAAGVCIDHDVVIDDFVIIYPNSYIGGEVQLKKGVCIGPCSVIMRKTIIPEKEEIRPLSIIG